MSDRLRVRDVTYQEDKSLVRTGNAPRVMASLAGPGHQPAAHRRPRQHRRRQPPPRPRPAAHAQATSDRMNDFAGSLARGGAAPRWLIAEYAISSIHSCHPWGGAGHSGEGRQPGDGTQPGGGAGQFGGGLNLYPIPSHSPPLRSRTAPHHPTDRPWHLAIMHGSAHQRSDYQYQQIANGKFSLSWIDIVKHFGVKRSPEQAFPRLMRTGVTHKSWSTRPAGSAAKCSSQADIYRSQIDGIDLLTCATGRR